MVDDSELAPGDDMGQRGRKKPRITSRVPPVIEGRAEDVTPPPEASSASSATPNPPPETQVDPNIDTTSFEAADAPLAEEVPHVPPPEGPVSDAPMPAEPGAKTEEPVEAMVEPTAALVSDGEQPTAPRQRSFGPLAAGILVVVLGAGALAWFVTGDGDFFNGGKTPASTAPATKSADFKTDGPVTDSAKSDVRTPPSGTASSNTIAKAPASISQPPAPAATTPMAQPSVAPPPPISATTPPPVRIEPPPAMTAKAEAPAPAVTPAANDARFADLNRRVSDLDGKITALSSSAPKVAPETTSALTAQTARLGKIEDTLAAIDKRLATLEQRLNAPKSDARAPQAPDVGTRDIDSAAARTVVAQGLLAAVQAGTPFATQIAALRALGAEDSGLARLSSAAAGGVPTLAALRESFVAVRGKLKSPTKVDPAANWSDKMVARLSSLVTIRPAAEKAGPAPEAVASRIDAALGRGDLTAALAEARTLPAADAALIKDWTDSAQRRADAESDARALVAASLATLAKPKS